MCTQVKRMNLSPKVLVRIIIDCPICKAQKYFVINFILSRQKLILICNAMAMKLILFSMQVSFLISIRMIPTLHSFQRVLISTISTIFAENLKLMNQQTKMNKMHGTLSLNAHQVLIESK